MRELIAIQKNLPKRWIIKDEILIRLAESYAKKDHKLYQDYAVSSYSEGIQERLIRTIENFWQQATVDQADEELS